nr:hypothetical protein [Bacillus dakarensis]
MKIYMVVLYQMIIWSSYTLIEWLSKYDDPLYNILMFLVFFYIAVVSGNYMIKSIRKTFMISVFSLAAYGLIQLILNYI